MLSFLSKLLVNRSLRGSDSKRMSRKERINVVVATNASGRWKQRRRVRGKGRKRQRQRQRQKRWKQWVEAMAETEERLLLAVKENSVTDAAMP